MRPLEDGDAELMEHESLAAVLNHLLVKPGLRRNGLAHQLCLHLEDVAEAWGLATLLMFPPERNGDARWLCAKLGMREGFRTDSTRDPSRRVVAMGKVPGGRHPRRRARLSFPPSILPVTTSPFDFPGLRAGRRVFVRDRPYCPGGGFS